MAHNAPKEIVAEGRRGEGLHLKRKSTQHLSRRKEGGGETLGGLSCEKKRDGGHWEKKTLCAKDKGPCFILGKRKEGELGEDAVSATDTCPTNPPRVVLSARLRG